MDGDRSINLTDGELVKPLLMLSLPIVLTNMLQVGYNLADTFWVGRLGQDAVSALSFSWALIFLVISLAGGFTVACTVLVSQNKGAGNEDHANHVAGQAIAFLVGLSAFTSLVGYVFAPTLLTAVGATPGSAEYQLSLEYTRTMFLGIPFMFGFFIFQSLLQGWGDTKTPFYLMTFGVVLNVVADPFFILGFQNNILFEALGLTGLEQSLYDATGFAGMGVQGAALATIASRGLGAVIAMGMLLSGRVGLKPSPGDFVPDLETIREMVKIGAPASVEESTRAVGVMLLTALVAIVGDDAVAAYGIGNRLTSLVILPAIGLARGTETVVGQNLGADQVERAKRAVYASAGIVVTIFAVVSVVAFVFAEPITSAFITGENSDAVIDLGGDYLQIVGLSFAFLGIFRIVQGGFRGSGSTRTAMIFSILALIVFRIPPAYLLVELADMGATGVWYGIAFSNVVIAIVAGAWFLRGTWTDNVVDSDDLGPGMSMPDPEPEPEPDTDD
ncbi:MATE family efflux transporter [Halorussus caseinilyticus]|uniref:MATE family efflux transporter n=1 Tax=Halorussus caseinilyticus TaxID=3034025 RepID=A0ABD5WEX8_9EURY|nr:MATE family efflux transporter [Halorussus sp. DT72]